MESNKSNEMEEGKGWDVYMVTMKNGNIYTGRNFK